MEKMKAREEKESWIFDARIDTSALVSEPEDRRRRWILSSCRSYCIHAAVGPLSPPTCASWKFRRFWNRSLASLYEPRPFFVILIRSNKYRRAPDTKLRDILGLPLAKLLLDVVALTASVEMPILRPLRSGGFGILSGMTISNIYVWRFWLAKTKWTSIGYMFPLLTLILIRIS